MRQVWAVMAVTLWAGSALAGAPTASAKLPFVEDDYKAALATARERKLPLFIDAWAPW